MNRAEFRARNRPYSNVLKNAMPKIFPANFRAHANQTPKKTKHIALSCNLSNRPN